MTAKAASQLWKDGDSAQALEAAWTGFDGGDLDGGILAARILREEPALLQAGRAESLRRLLTNPRISPRRGEHGRVAIPVDRQRPVCRNQRRHRGAAWSAAPWR
ncbi:MAG: hypothetical protein WDM81_06010 [Rhizomicrobium sp.]